MYASYKLFFPLNMTRQQFQKYATAFPHFPGGSTLYGQFPHSRLLKSTSIPTLTSQVDFSPISPSPILYYRSRLWLSKSTLIPTLTSQVDYSYQNDS